MISIASWIDSIIRRVSRSFTSQAFGTLPNFLSLALEQQVVTLFHVLELSRCSTNDQDLAATTRSEDQSESWADTEIAGALSPATGPPATPANRASQMNRITRAEIPDIDLLSLHELPTTSIRRGCHSLEKCTQTDIAGN